MVNTLFYFLLVWLILLLSHIKIYKDIQFSKLFHQSNQNKVNLKGSHFNSYSLFAIRDMMTISSEFILKPDLNRYLENKYNISHNKADFISSMTLPIITQLFSTPIHILSINYLQKPEISFSQRLQHIKNIYYGVCIGRMIRVIPAFCIGGFMNDILILNIFFFNYLGIFYFFLYNLINL
jgi:hypothetical protein